MQQRSAEETVDLVKLVSQWRVQQRTAEQIEDICDVTLLPRERVQQRSAEQMVELPQPPSWSDEHPSSEEVEREMRAQEALWAAKARRRRVRPYRWQMWH